jgi:small ligand-binding sensory domain FIST
VNTEFSISAHWPDGFDEEGLRHWVEQMRSQLDRPVSLGLVFMSPDFFPYAAQTLEILRVHGRIPLLAGCSGAGLIVNGEEIESASGIVLGLYSLPGAELKGFHFTPSQIEEAAAGSYWHSVTGIDAAGSNGWLVFHDPFHMDADNWIRWWNDAYAPVPTFGGAASGIFSDQSTQVYLNGEVFEDGLIAISVGGDVTLTGVVSQGCTPIGEPWTLTRVEQNLIHQIANRPAYSVLAETFQKLPPADQQKARGNLLIGLAVNEYLEDFHRGDFLVRPLIGGDPASGILSVGALPRAGQTMQFQRRDAAAASEDMHELLVRAKEDTHGKPIYGGCLCCCNGRGKNLFGVPNHDAGLIQRELGPLGVSGFFCAGEIGPVGKKSFLHGFTAALAMFVKR